MRTFATLALLLASAAPAVAAPSIDAVAAPEWTGRSLVVTATVTMGAPGEVRLAGDLNGASVALARRLPAGTRAVKLKVDVRRLGFATPDEPLRFHLALSAEESGGGIAERDVDVVVPVPLAVLFGLLQEYTPGALDAFAAAIDLAAGGDHTREGKRPNLLVHPYTSIGPALPDLGAGFAQALRRFVKRTGFARADVVGYSMGGLVARRAMQDGAAGLVRKVVFVGSPNEGTPVAYLGAAAAAFGVTGTVPGLDPAIASALLDPAAQETLRLFYPVYPWYPPEQAVVFLLLPDPATPLTALNAGGPVPGVEYHAIACSAPGTLETVDFTALAPLITSGTLTAEGFADAIVALSSGTGDGVVPLRSVFFRDDPLWDGVIVEHDVGPGTHTAMPADPRVLAEIAAILGE